MRHSSNRLATYLVPLWTPALLAAGSTPFEATPAAAVLTGVLAHVRRGRSVGDRSPVGDSWERNCDG